MRYDLQLVFKRLDRVRSEPGYQGSAVVCAVYFSPIAGYVRDRYAIKYLMQLRDMEMWLAPIAGTRVMVPYRASVPTPIGLGVLRTLAHIHWFVVQRVLVERLGPYLLPGIFNTGLPPGNIRPPWVIVE